MKTEIEWVKKLENGDMEVKLVGCQGSAVFHADSEVGRQAQITLFASIIFKDS